ncbi:hypothetical protein BDV93DRAFT_608018 [Ceratobasidium sp. AG-I]|nr:hypothetical protein BDV93DRAFT_608018 [Ceratobasidium sp. AG-I]
MDLHSTLPSALQQWNDARAHLSKAIQVYISAVKLFESNCTPSGVRSLPGCAATIKNNLESIEREELQLCQANLALKQKRNSLISPIHSLPSEVLAIILTAATAPRSSYGMSGPHFKRHLSQVCSRWRPIALDVCPVWDRVTLGFEAGGNFGDELARTKIGFRGGYVSGYTQVPVGRPPGLDEASYIQKTLNTIDPYIRLLGQIDFTAEDVEQVRPFLDFWLEKGVPGSLAELIISVKKTAPIVPETNSHLSDRLTQYIRHIDYLKLTSVGLDWPSVEFGRLRVMWLVNLPPVCSPTLAQLARILSTCPTLTVLHLEDIALLASLDTVVLKSVVLEQLSSLILKEVDIAGVLSIISPGLEQLALELHGVTGDTDTLEALNLFAGRANLLALTLTLSDTRSDVALAQVLHSVTSPLLSLKYLTLEDMDLRASELGILAGHSLPQNIPPLSLALVGATGISCPIDSLDLKSCIIHASLAVFHEAISSVPWATLMFRGCKRSLTVQGESNNEFEPFERINNASNFGTQLRELMPGRQWVEARTHLTKAIHAYISATTVLESMSTPFSPKSLSIASSTIEKNLEAVARDVFDLQSAQAALKKRRNPYISPIDVLPSELLADVFKTAVVLVSNDGSPNEHVKKNLLRVCSR